MANQEEQINQQPHQYSLMGITIARYREAFGEPFIQDELDRQWTLKTSPFGHDIHVLLVGSVNSPVTWIFDANDRNDGVSRSLLEHEDSIIEIVDHVRDRIKKAVQTVRKSREPKEEADE